MSEAPEGTLRRLPRLALLLAWLLVLVAAGLYVSRELVIGADLRLFMPSPHTNAERLLLEEIGEGPASRLLLVALEGAPQEALADSSIALAESLAGEPALRWVANGGDAAASVPERLLPYRYLLSHSLDGERLDAATLGREFAARARDLASPAAGLLEPWVPRDPTLETLKLLESWQPTREPERRFDVWFDRAGQRALLLAETQAAGFDPDGQGLAIARIKAAFAGTRTNPAMKLVVSGPGAFSVLVKDKTQAEAQRVGTLATVGMILLLLVAYRRIGVVVQGSLPLASAGLAGLAAVSAIHGEVHGITLAFGFTLIGVAQDYPMHLFSHQRPGVAPLQAARELWPTLSTGVASTCIAYLAFVASGVSGLAQLATFTVTGLAVAGLTTRFLLPRLIDPDQPDHGESAWLGRLWSVIARLPQPRLLASGLAAGGIAVILLVPGPLWDNQLGGLTPIPQELLLQDAALRAELGAAELRYLGIIEETSVEGALRHAETLDPVLAKLAADGVVGSYDHIARYVPSAATQLRRQAALPDEPALRAAVATGLQGQPFRAETFEPFVADVAAARRLEPLAPSALAGTPLGTRLEGLLNQKDGKAVAIITFTGVRDPVALTKALESQQATLLDLKAAAETLVVSQRSRILASLAVAAVLLIVVVWRALGSLQRARRVLAPMTVSTIIILAALHAAGVPLNLFHLISLVLAAGLGLDYALFFEHAADEPGEQRRTLHAVLVCSLSTLLVFALLAASSVPVLRAIGVTVTIGVIANFVLALVLTRTQPGARA